MGNSSYSASGSSSIEPSTEPSTRLSAGRASTSHKNCAWKEKTISHSWNTGGGQTTETEKEDCQDETCATSRANHDNDGKSTEEINDQYQNDGKTGPGSAKTDKK